jgi:hypothetical protein
MILSVFPFVVVAACLVGAIAAGSWSLFLAIPLYFVGMFFRPGIKGAIILTVIIAALAIGIGVESMLVRLGLPAAALVLFMTPQLFRRFYVSLIFGGALRSETIFAFLFSVRQISLDIPGGKHLFHTGTLIGIDRNQ